MLNAKLAENTTLSIQEYSRQMKVLMKKKQNLIAWIVSNCQFTNGAKKRLHIVKSFEDQSKSFRCEVRKWNSSLGLKNVYWMYG